MKKTVILCISVLLLACNNNPELDDIPPIDPNITIELREVLGTDSRNLMLYCKTEKIYPCINFPILTEKTVDKDSYKITFTGIGEIGICLTAIGPASTVIELNSTSNGNYQIELNNGNLKNKGTLEVSDSEIAINIAQQNGIEILRPVTKRVPSKTYWGTIGYHTESTINKVNEFLQKLKDNGAIFNKQNPGHYFYYEIDQNGDIVTNTENSGYYFMKASIFQYNGDEVGFKQQIKELAVPYYDDMSINVQTYKGEQINNWTK